MHSFPLILTLNVTELAALQYSVIKSNVCCVCSSSPAGGAAPRVPRPHGWTVRVRPRNVFACL